MAWVEGFWLLLLLPELEEAAPVEGVLLVPEPEPEEDLLVFDESMVVDNVVG